MDSPSSNPRAVQNFAIAAVAVLIALAGFACAVGAFVVVPKCRYGDDACYFEVSECAFNAGISPHAGSLKKPSFGDVHDEWSWDDGATAAAIAVKGCHKVLKLRAIESSGDHGLEPLALPLFSSCVALLGPVVVLFAVTLADEEEEAGALAYLEAGRVLIGAGVVLMPLSIHHLQNLTHDCRWWGDFHHGHSYECHTSFGLFVAAAVLMGVSQSMLLFRILSRATSSERHRFAKAYIGIRDTSLEDEMI